MKKILSTVLVLTYAMSLTELYATTTTAGAAPTSTAGMYQTQTPTTAKPAPAPQGGTATGGTRPATAPVCVDSGILGARCGVKAEQYCRNNPDNPDCRKILNEDKERK